MVTLQFLFLASLFAVLIYSFKRPHTRKLASSPLKVSRERYNEAMALNKENGEYIKAIIKRSEETRNSTKVEFQAYIKARDESYNAIRKAMKKLSKSIRELKK